MIRRSVTPASVDTPQSQGVSHATALLPGTTSCNAYPSLDVVLLEKMTSTGTYSRKFAVPKNTALDCFKVFTQAFPFDKRANAWGTSATAYGRLRIGL